MLIFSVAFFSWLAVAGNRANPDACELAPLPMPVSFSSDMDRPVSFDASTQLVVECPDASGLEWLNAHLVAWYGAFSPKGVAGPAGLALRPGDEAYAVRADATGVKIAARTPAGVRWAAYSLRQLAIERRGTFRTAGYLLPTLEVSDAPHLAFRGIHLCWLPELRRELIEREIRLAALLKFNFVVLEPWGMFRSERHPWLSWPDAKMTKEEVRRLVGLARDLGVTLVPQFPSFGHAGSSRTKTLKHAVLEIRPEYAPLFEPGGWNWCLTNPETQRVLRELIDEMHAAFGRPPYVHLGCDEAQPPTCPECRRCPYGDVVCEHIAGLAAYVKSLGAQAMIWHDMLLDKDDPRWKGYYHNGTRDTAKMADLLPKDVVVCDWQYAYGKRKDVRTDWPTVRYFREKGFPVLGCPWQNYAEMRPMADVLREVGALGYLGTTWNHLRGGDAVAMYRYHASAAWGTPVRGTGAHGATPQYDTEFAILLQLVSRDMKVTDYRDCGDYEYQVPPSWWLDD